MSLNPSQINMIFNKKDNLSLCPNCNSIYLDYYGKGHCYCNTSPCSTPVYTTNQVSQYIPTELGEGVVTCECNRLTRAYAEIQELNNTLDYSENTISNLEGEISDLTYDIESLEDTLREVGH